MDFVFVLFRIEGMKNYILSAASVAIVGLSLSCAHHRDVRPSSDGIHKVTFQTEDKAEGYRNAMSQAEDYCKEMANGKSPAIVSEQSQYSGTMNEENYNTAKTASKVAQAVGGAGYVFGGKAESNAGGIVGLGGGIASSAIGQGYTYEMKFRCQ